jgi:hypothetical protein
MNMTAAASTRGPATREIPTHQLDGQARQRRIGLLILGDTDAQSFSDAIVTVSDRRQHYGTQLSPIGRNNAPLPAKGPPWMAMTMAHAITEAAISTTSGITTDFTDFGFDIATPR